jgi:hypothetical protein
MSILDNRIYYINSENRLSGTSNNFSYTLDIPDGARYDSVCVLSMTIPRSYYVVREGYNSFILQLDATSHTITVPAGNYTSLSFISVLKPLLTAAGGTWTMSISTVTGKYTYGYVGTATVKFIFSNPSRISHQMGFDETSSNTFVAGALVSANVVDFVSTSTLFLHSDMVQDQSSILQEVYSDNSVPFSNLVYNCKFPAMYSKTLQNARSNTFQFSLQDEHDTLVELNGHELCVTLLMYKKENLTRLFKAIFTRQE